MKSNCNIIIGADSGLKNVLTLLRKVAAINTSVLLLGETGVGKELIANMVHASSDRKDGPFIKVNCGAIPDDLIDSELFGHERGAFTGALSQKSGRFERAHGGTIFLDEIGELSLAAQVRLLRVLQFREFERVGGTETISVDVRIVSATHQNLEDLVRCGKFREDLFFRLNVFPITIPPLRQRIVDIPPLVDYFIRSKSMKLKIDTVPSVSPENLHRLQAYHWPGNVRELENLVERALIQSRVLGAKFFLHPNEKNPAFPKQKEPISSLDDIIATHILNALEKTGGKIGGPSGAARLLKLNPNTLRSRMKKMGIRYDSRECAPASQKNRHWETDHQHDFHIGAT
jgi:transcriptional regulator with GAF, ATPase, and Fis domain